MKKGVKKKSVKPLRGRSSSQTLRIKKSVKKTSKKKSKKKSPEKKIKFDTKKFPTLKLDKEDEIARDFAVKAYKKFDKLVKSIILFGSVAKKEIVAGSDIDIIIVIDDVSVKWDSELIAWYRVELEKIIKANPYRESLHINTIKLSSWWEDLMRGDPILINILRYGEAMVDIGGFFEPLKYLLAEGKIRPTPEAIYNALNRAPEHLMRAKMALLGSVDGLFWAMVDSSHAALIALNIAPPSPEHIPADLGRHLVSGGRLKQKYLDWFKEMLIIHKKVNHGEIKDLSKMKIKELHDRAEEFVSIMANIVKDIVEKK